jgi:hypothetical protein
MEGPLHFSGSKGRSQYIVDPNKDATKTAAPRNYWPRTGEASRSLKVVSSLPSLDVIVNWSRAEEAKFASGKERLKAAAFALRAKESLVL